MRNYRTAWRVLGILALAFPAAALAEDDVYVPDELQPWREWVLHGRDHLDCPFLFDRREAGRDSYVCAWPGELELTIAGDGSRFAQSWTVYGSEQWVPLPGDGRFWPEQVTADGRGIAVSMRESGPRVRLGPGRHSIAGRINWEERPRTLPVPAATGLLRLSIDGNRIARPERNGNTVWLGERETPHEADAIGVQVYRLVADDVPTRLVTRFNLEVSGSTREELIAPALPEGFIPTALESKLPARLEAGGELRVQVRPGSWQVELVARGRGVLNEIPLPEPVHNLPGREIWSYESDDSLRVTVPQGLPPVDPLQVSVPENFRTLPAFRIEPSDTLTIVERSRGKVAVDNQLRLRRLLWLDFDGGGFTFSDAIDGTMQSDWRLDMAPPYALLSASQAGANLLVTLGSEEGLTGVELRQRNLDLQATGRVDTRGTVPASGWQARFNAITTELNLPPGQKLIAAIGADWAPRAWADRWQLLDFFLVLIITLATARMFGAVAGAVAFLALVLSWHESGAPQWAWLNLLAAAALVRVAPAGRLRATARFYRGASAVALLVLLVPFFAAELRLGIYPQLEPQRGYGAVRTRQVTPDDSAAPAPTAASDERERVREELSRVEEITVQSAGPLFGYERYARYAPNAIVQAGPGRPSWSWNTYDLYWSGPIDLKRTLRLVVMPRWLVTVLRFIEVLLLLTFAALFVFEVLGLERRWPPRRSEGPAPPAPPLVAGTLLLIAAGLAGAPPALAQTPSPEILQQLEQRLLEPPPCSPRCAEIVEGRATVGRDALAIELAVHALETVAVPLPGSLQGWRPESVRVDGAPVPYVSRSVDETLWLRVTEGRHRIVLQGPLPPVGSLEIPFPAAPRVFTAEAEGWSLTGIDDRRLVTGSLQLTRLRENGATDASRWESSRFPEFVRIERTVKLDLDWEAHTVVTRIAPKRGAITLEVPLLPGASLLTADLPVTDGAVRISFGPAEQSVEWIAALPRTSPLELSVAEGAPWKEVWRFGIGNIWHASFSGVPESESAGPPDEVRITEFYPRGGESLTLTATRPAASRGNTLAFDAVSITTDVGVRSRNVVMTLDYRSTRGAQHVVRLPPGAEVMQVAIDGRSEPLRADDGELSLPILPGEHRIEVRWRRDEEIASTLRTPPVELGAPASNIMLELELPASRWVLAASGPALGPAVMYWSELAAMILFALILGRVRLTPLTMRHWLLLGLGFSTFSWSMLALVAVWLLGIGARARWRVPDDIDSWRFDAVQVAVAALTVAALVGIVVSVPTGLLGSPDMHIAGNASHGNSLRWFADRSVNALPNASVFSLPLWVYKVVILAWALWLSFALLRWLRWVWQSFTRHGLWHGRATVTAEGV